MNNVFADSGFWIALLDRDDVLHAKAVDRAGAVRGAKTFTSQMVLTEVLTWFAKLPRSRLAAAGLCDRIYADADYRVVDQTPDLFLSALDLYRRRPDKEWSLTDCASFIIMERYGILDALTPDRHFEQAGFNALLRNGS